MASQKPYPTHQHHDETGSQDCIHTPTWGHQISQESDMYEWEWKISEEAPSLCIIVPRLHNLWTGPAAVRQTEESITLGDWKELFGGIMALDMDVGKQKRIQVIKKECVWAAAVWPVWMWTHLEQHHAIVITALSRLLQASWLLENNLHSAGQIIAE